MKKKQLLFISLLGITLTISSCAYVVDPIACDKFKDCKETIRKTYALQPPKKAPADVEVTDEYIMAERQLDIHHNITGATTTHDTKNLTYFKDIKKLRVSKKFGRCEIVFKNKANNVVTVIVLSNTDYMIQGYSAIKCMIDQAAKSKENDKY